MTHTDRFWTPHRPTRPRLLKGPKSSPVFITERKARVLLPAADLDPSSRAWLSYQQAAALFSGAW
jgi:integrase/recombinase XerC/integrase/recombinase XerD